MYGTCIKKLLLNNHNIINYDFLDAYYSCNWCRLQIQQKNNSSGIWDINYIDIYGQDTVLFHMHSVKYKSYDYTELIAYQRMNSKYKINSGKWVDNCSIEQSRMFNYYYELLENGSVDTKINILLKDKYFGYYYDHEYTDYSSSYSSKTISLNLPGSFIESENPNVYLIGDIITLYSSNKKDFSNWIQKSSPEAGYCKYDGDLSHLYKQEIKANINQYFTPKERIVISSNCITHVDLNFSNIKFHPNYWKDQEQHGLFKDCVRLKTAILNILEPEVINCRDSFRCVFFETPSIENITLYFYAPEKGTYRPKTMNNLPPSMMYGTGWKNETEYKRYLQLLHNLQGYDSTRDPNSPDFDASLSYHYDQEDLDSFNLTKVDSNPISYARKNTCLSLASNNWSNPCRITVVGFSKTNIKGEGYEGSIEDISNKILHQLWWNNNQTYGASWGAWAEIYYVYGSSKNGYIKYSTLGGWITGS